MTQNTLTGRWKPFGQVEMCLFSQHLSQSLHCRDTDFLIYLIISRAHCELIFMSESPNRVIKKLKVMTKHALK